MLHPKACDDINVNVDDYVNDDVDDTDDRMRVPTHYDRLSGIFKVDNCGVPISS